MSKETSRREFLGTAGLAAAGIVAPSAPSAPSAPAVQAQTTARTSPGARFKQLLRRPEPFYCIAAFDSPSARLLELAGYESIFAGGSMMAMEQGVPDWGLTNNTELLEFATRLTRNTDLPVMGDADSGGGNPVSVYRLVKAFEKAGLAAMLVEDRLRVERIGQKAAVISTEKMVDRIHAALDARSDLNIVVRSDALASGESLDQALDRAKAYAAAGADAIFAGIRLENMRQAIAAIPIPLFVQLGADDSAPDAIKNGAHVLFYTSMMHDIALAAYFQALTELKTTGMLPKTYNAHKLPNGINAKLERSDEILALAKKYKLAP